MNSWDKVLKRDTSVERAAFKATPYYLKRKKQKTRDEKSAANQLAHAAKLVTRAKAAERKAANRAAWQLERAANQKPRKVTELDDDLEKVYAQIPVDKWYDPSTRKFSTTLKKDARVRSNVARVLTMHKTVVTIREAEEVLNNRGLGAEVVDFLLHHRFINETGQIQPDALRWYDLYDIIGEEFQDNGATAFTLL